MTDKVRPEAISDDELDVASGGIERTTMNYEKIEWTYHRQSTAAARGSKGGKVETTWKIEEGEK
ncbi:MAG: hypothetical protein AAF293_04635 [Pseudomonadota bacterium]